MCGELRTSLIAYFFSEPEGDGSVANEGENRNWARLRWSDSTFSIESTALSTARQDYHQNYKIPQTALHCTTNGGVQIKTQFYTSEYLGIGTVARGHEDQIQIILHLKRFWKLILYSLKSFCQLVEGFVGLKYSSVDVLVNLGTKINCPGLGLPGANLKIRTRKWLNASNHCDYDLLLSGLMTRQNICN